MGQRPSDDTHDWLRRNRLEWLFLSQNDELLKFFASRTLDVDAASELVSETFMRATAELRELPFRDRAAARVWLRRLAHQELGRFYRRQSESEDVSRASPEPLSDRVADSDAADGAVAEIIDSLDIQRGPLSPRDRIILHLRFVGELPFEEIGRRTGTTAEEARRIHTSGLRAVAGLAALEFHEGLPQPTLLGPDGKPLRAARLSFASSSSVSLRSTMT